MPVRMTHHMREFTVYLILHSDFDPIFYLHHCNVDRIIAFWEHIYPKYYMGDDGYLAEDGTRKPFSKSCCHRR